MAENPIARTLPKSCLTLPASSYVVHKLPTSCPMVVEQLSKSCHTSRELARPAGRAGRQQSHAPHPKDHINHTAANGGRRAASLRHSAARHAECSQSSATTTGWHNGTSNDTMPPADQDRHHNPIGNQRCPGRRDRADSAARRRQQCLLSGTGSGRRPTPEQGAPGAICGRRRSSPGPPGSPWGTLRDVCRATLR